MFKPTNSKEYVIRVTYTYLKPIDSVSQSFKELFNKLNFNYQTNSATHLFVCGLVHEQFISHQKINKYELLYTAKLN